MNLGLESDLANQNFAGAVNPDKLLHIEFYMFEPLDQHKSQMAGKRVYQTVHIPDGPEQQVQVAGGMVSKFQPMKDTGERVKTPFIRIMKPGDNTSILEVPVREDHKRRWPEEWLYFASKEGLIDSGDQIPGWKIDEWPHVNSDVESMRNLKYLRFYTVEQIAGASDAQIQRLGMGGNGLRLAAQTALKNRVAQGISAEIATKDAEIAALKKADEENKERLTKLEALLNKPQAANKPIETATPVPVAPKKKGWPKGKSRKPKEVTSGEQHIT